MATTEYATSTQVKSALSMTSETFADTEIARAVVAASRQVDNYCNRRFYLDDDANQVRYYSGERGDYISIDDVSTITSVKTDTSLDGTFGTTLAAVTDYNALPLNAAADGWPYTYLKINPQSAQCFPIGERTVKVTGKFGWTTIPGPVTDATVLQAITLMKSEREGSFGIVQVGLDGATARVPALHPHAVGLLQPYVKMQAV